MSRLLTIPTGLAIALALAACNAEPPARTQDSESAPEASLAASPSYLESAQAVGLRNAAMPSTVLLTAAQPSPEQLDALADGGFQHFISLRLPGEDGAGWEESHAAGVGLDFERLPISGTDALTRENVDALAELLDATGGEPTVLYCGSSNRVGALLALKAYWVDGASPEDAFALGQQAGMTSLAEPVGELLGLATPP